jgi:hypothetical protein
MRCYHLRKRLGMGAELTLESLRHAFATDGASKLLPLELAQVMNTSVAMLQRVYTKLHQRDAEMHAAASKVREPKRGRKTT